MRSHVRVARGPESLEARCVGSRLLIRARTVPVRRAPCGASQPRLSHSRPGPVLHVSPCERTARSGLESLLFGALLNENALCVHTHFKQLSQDPELLPDPKANMTFDNLPLRSLHYFHTLMPLEVSAGVPTFTLVVTHYYQPSAESPRTVSSLRRADVDAVRSTETGGN